MRLWWVHLCLVIMALSVTGGFAQHRNPLEYIQILESAERVKKLQVDRVIKRLGLKEGQNVADLGAGSGLFSRPLARYVGPSGTVYAVDIDRDLLAHVEETALEQNLKNIKTVVAGEYDARIPEKVDLILICDTLHQIKDPATYLKDLTRYIRLDGRVAIIDYGEKWPARLESARFTVEELDEWMRVAGFRRVEEHTFLKDNFFVIYRFEPETH